MTTGIDVGREVVVAHPPTSVHVDRDQLLDVPRLHEVAPVLAVNVVSGVSGHAHIVTDWECVEATFRALTRSRSINGKPGKRPLEMSFAAVAALERPTAKADSEPDDPSYRDHSIIDDPVRAKTASMQANPHGDTRG
ncbi:hypothetical protein ABZX92_45045 [Lentzea sp. NPDC006480]|uniref:hypothetical protein n=1 Tax=Lentzea sp. NPDC006480 TaxID=3157176 RepID=UPI0033B65187